MSESKGVIEAELEQAIAASKAPQFEVMALDLHKRRWQMDGVTDSRYYITLHILLDGQPIQVVDEQTAKRTKKGLAYDGRLGSVDLMERALRAALLKRWPEIEPFLKTVKTAGYSVHAVGNEESHHVQVSLQVIGRKNKEPRYVVREGVDTIGVTFDALVTIYHWVAWRLLRRLRGEERKNSGH